MDAVDSEDYESYLRDLSEFSNQSERKLAFDNGELQQRGSYLMTDLLSSSYSLGGYQNYEQNAIREAYSSTSYASIRDLPNLFRPGEVVLARQLKVLEMQKVKTLPEKVLAARRAAAKNNGLFQQFDYVPSRYTLIKEIEAQERIRKKAKALELGGGQEFLYSSSAVRAKYEDGFGDKEYRFPYLSGTFDSTEVVRSNELIKDKAKILHGPFLPTSRTAQGKGLVNKTHLPKIQSIIEQLLVRDWGDCLFEVNITEDEMVAVRFELLQLDGQLLGLRSYMNMLESTNKQIQRFLLTRSGKEWNIQPGDGWIYFKFRPLWVKMVC